MVATTRSKGNLTLLPKASKAGITKRSKSTSANALSSRLAHDGSTTPTPAVAKAMATPSSQTPNVAVPIARPASLTATNALLVSPPLAPTQVSPHASAASPSPSGSTTTTSDILKAGIAHLLSVEPKLAPLIESHPCALFSPAGLAEPVDPFYSLMSGIISQQISSAAARSIKSKFISLFQPALENAGLTFPTPAMVLGCSQEFLRTGGLSTRKAEYAHSLAETFVGGDLSAEILSSASDEEVVRRLVAVKGIGAWSAEMFLMFGLKRMDVFSLGDLGIQRGQAVIAGRDVGKLKNGGKGKWKYMSEEDMIKHSEPFRPYRSLYMWYLWKASDVSVESLKNTTSSSGAAAAAAKKKKAPAKKASGPE
ncbi:DNA glycosylase [Morchella conica CCBAS932]|uniref:DNA glycosylase n=1 Tax=Morchella conica CCBAS932 TaxID=1392247 RepID=A0A3N4KBI3_9PEZI|nr:DNA glycosylase [Morchella conica CCBAS932]